ncbi:MAG: bifunctional hydroxymethylpyrimidine kinase/phosphomethylpyrimidine kinase, partial [Lachnospiraceae bacterium]|nr:bifunctional hydroxymethylpyrimidine kinase/phosphomethylpyrimidine kinase [Lachnospiraceae bacterium]
ATMLQIMGAKSVVITGVREGNFYTNVVLEHGKHEAEFVKVKSAGNQRPGTGDVFSSVLAGSVLNGYSLRAATEKAARFVRDCITKSDELNIPHSNGVCFEEIVGKLVKR